MKVRLMSDVSGTRNGAPWPPRGSIVELPDDEAVIMLQNGMAKELRDEDDPETAVLMPDSVEDATVKAAQMSQDDRRPVLDHDRDRLGTVDTSHATQVRRDATTGDPVTDEDDAAAESAADVGDDDAGPLTTKTGPTRRVSKTPPKS